MLDKKRLPIYLVADAEQYGSGQQTIKYSIEDEQGKGKDKMSKDQDQTQEPKERKARKMYFLCGAIKNDAIVSERIEVSSRESRDEAAKSFKTKHKLAPTLVEGPWYEVKGGATVQAQSRKTVSVPARAATDLTMNRWQGAYEGWNFIGMGLKACTGKDGVTYKDDELVFLTEEGPVAEGNPKPKFGGAVKIIQRGQLENATKL